MLKTFKRGGIHPDDSKRWTKDIPIEVMPLSKRLIIPLSMSIGAPSKPVVEAGAHVMRGDLLAEKGGAVSANISSPASGTVKAFRSLVTPQGSTVQAIELETDEPDSIISNEMFKMSDDAAVHAYSKADIDRLIEKAGVVGMGGATFPAVIKYSIPDTKRVDYLLINACECEPFLTSDYRLLVEKKKEIIKGIEILNRVFTPKYTFFCTEQNKQEEALKLEDEKKNSAFAVQILKNKYPQGDEKSIINAVTGREVPSGKLPLDIGCVVVNLGTLVAVYEAVYMSKPCTERIVTVSGAGINEPKNLLVPIGTPVRDVFEYCGGLKDGVSKLIAGGPMMGFSFYDLDTPVTKGTSGLLAFVGGKPEETFPCISCGRCVNACPIGLMPTLMYKNIVKGNVDEAIKLHLLDCRECGCCDYSCPANINLVQGFRLGKKLWRAKKK